MAPSLLDAVRALMYQGVSLGDLPAALLRARGRTLAVITIPVLAAAAAALLLPRWYESGATLTIEAGTTPIPPGGVLGLASQLGLAATDASRSPQFYSDLLRSRVLLEHVLSAQFPLAANGGLQDLETYWNEGRAPTPRLHDRAIEKLQDRLSASANARTGVITFTLEGPSKPVAKLMADTALAALNDLVVSIRQKHATAERQFTEERWKALRDSLTAREEVLRRFYEHNRQITSPELQFEELRLRREVERVQTVYAQIGAQLEQARIQEVRDIPVISVIDPPIEPIRKSSPKGKLLLATAAVLGAAVAVILTLVQMARESLRHHRDPQSVAPPARA